MNISINELQVALNATFKHIKESYGEDFNIKINEDYYFHIPKEELYTVESDPRNLTVGSLADDISEIRRIINKNDTVTYDLVKMASVLRYIGENIT